MFSAFHYFAADKLIDRDVLLLPPPLVTCLKYIASAAVHPTTLDAIFNFPQRTQNQRIDIVLRSIFYFDSFPDELRIVIDPSLILTILLICSWYLAMVWAMCTSWGQVMMFAFRKSHSEPFSWKAVISHSSDCMFSPRFSTPMYRRMFSWFMWGSLNISCSASQDCLSWKHQLQVQFINAVLLRCTRITRKITNTNVIFLNIKR